MIKKIVIAGASTFTRKNLGDEAMLLNLIQAIKDTIRKLRLLYYLGIQANILINYMELKQLKTLNLIKENNQ